MELLDARRSILVLIDYQGRLAEIVENSRRVLTVGGRLLELAGMFQVPVVLTEQYPKGVGPTHPEIRAAFDALTTPKRMFVKTTFSCSADPAFGALLEELRPRPAGAPRQIVVGGLEAHVCVMGTVIELLRSGDQVHLCWDGISGRGAEYVRQALARMAAAGAILTNHESVGFEWARDKNHSQFKRMSELIKRGQPA